jgi:hypothetical protein
MQKPIHPPQVLPGDSSKQTGEEKTMIVACLVLLVIVIVLMLFNILLLAMLFVSLDSKLVPVDSRDRVEQEEEKHV